MNSPSITCVVPTHLRSGSFHGIGKYLRSECAPDEVFVVDDVDDGETKRTVEAIAESAPFPIRLLLNTESPGASSSRNTGAWAAKSTYLAFLDDDDVWLPEYLENVLGALTTRGATPADAVITGIRRVKHDGTHQSIVMPISVDPSSLYAKNPGMTGSNVVVSREAFVDIEGFDPRLPVRNDLDFLLRFINAGKTYTVVPELLVEWRDHAGDRITAHGHRRAGGIEIFLAKHEGAMTPRQRKDVIANVIGTQRRGVASVLERAFYAAKLLRLLGPREAIRRQTVDIRKAIKKGK